jgi:O-antigen ligase
VGVTRSASSYDYVPDPPDVGDGYAELRPSFLLKAAIVASYAGITVLRPALPRNTAFVDPLIALMCCIGLIKMMRHGSPATSAAARCLPWLWLILLGSLIGLSGVGFAAWGTSDLVVSYMAFLSLFAFWHIMYMTRTERYAIYGTAIGMAIVTFALVGGGPSRQEAYFAQPNYPGNYMGMAACIMFWWTDKRWVRALVVVSVLICIWKTGSFGAIALLLTFLVVWAWRSITKYSGILVVALVILVVGAAIYATGAPQKATSGGINVSPSLNTTRFDRSQNSRYGLWSQGWKAWVNHPMGVGPNGVLSRKFAQGYGYNLPIHNDLLSYLVERGPIGLIGLIGLWVVIWRKGRPRGAARMLVAGIVVSSLFRQVMHYRHVWMFLAIAFVIDARRAEAEDARAAAEEPLAVEA